MVWKKDATQANEVAKIRWELVPYTRGRGLDLGCGPNKAFPQFRGIDSNKDEALFNIRATDADLIVPTCEVLDDFASASQDFIFSSHLLEHIDNHEKALKEWWRLIKPGGHLCLYLPHKEFYPNVGTEGANPDHVHDFMPQDIIDAMKKIGGWDILVNEDRNGGDEYSFFQVYKKYADAKLHRYSCNDPKPEKTCAVIRYGAWGDAIQTTSILPGLKEQGYHITFFTVPRAWDAVKNDPLIDKVVLQDHEQVPNAWLGDYWRYLETRFDKVVNLSETVEGAYLAMPGRAPYQWSHEARHSYMNGNYTEFAHKVARVKFDKPLMRFVATDEEKKWAQQERKKIGAAPLIMWVLAGSSIHKVWAGIDTVLARVMLTMPQAKVITVGDARCKAMIEAPWENETRVIRRSGEWDIRQTMTMAHECDLVIGPETGVMNAVAMAPVPKIVLLSHSSIENLTRDWVNTYSVFSAKTPCWPCHKMVYTWDQCVRDEATGTAQCQADIHPDAVWDALNDAFKKAEAA